MPFLIAFQAVLVFGAVDDTVKGAIIAGMFSMINSILVWRLTNRDRRRTPKAPRKRHRISHRSRTDDAANDPGVDLGTGDGDQREDKSA